MLFELGGMALAIGTIVLVQDAIIGERQLGVTEWLLSKPVSRPAYVLSKLLAHGLGVLVILVGLQGAIGYGLLSLVMGEPLPLLPYLVGMAGLAVHTLFYLTLTLMLGVLTTNRNTLLGVSLGVIGGWVADAPVPGPARGQVRDADALVAGQPSAGRRLGGALAAVDLAAHRHHGRPVGHLCGCGPRQV